MKQYFATNDVNSIPIPDVKSFSGLDEKVMDKLYDSMRYDWKIFKGLVYRQQPISYYKLVIIGWVYKSNDENYKERQALLALEQLGKVKRVGNELWQTTDYDESTIDKVVDEKGSQSTADGSRK